MTDPLARAPQLTLATNNNTIMVQDTHDEYQPTLANPQPLDPMTQSMRLPAIEKNAVRDHFLTYGPLATINAAESPVVHNAMIRSAVAQAMQHDFPGYNSPRGLPDVLEATQAGLKKLYGLETTTDKMMINGGASEAIPSILRAHLQPNDEVLVVNPCFLPTRNFCQEAGMRPCGIDTAQSNFHLSNDLLKQALSQNPNAKALVFSDPGNPTGSVLDQATFTEITETLTSMKPGFLVIQDAPYAHQCIKKPFTPLAGIPASDQVKLFTVFSLSKAGGAGFRVGTTVTNQSDNLNPLIDRFSAKGPSIATPSQLALKAFMSPCDDSSGKLVAEVIAESQQTLIKNNLALVERLCEENGLSLASEHEGGSYCLINLGTSTGKEIFEAAMNNKGLLLMPGYLTNLSQEDTPLLRLPLTLPDTARYEQAITTIGQLVRNEI